MESKIIGAIAIFILLPLFGKTVHVRNEFCRARPSLVAIDSPSFKFFPYYVKLNRCGGSCDSIRPSIQGCVPIEYEEVPISVQVADTDTTVVIMEKNHTRCGCECVIGPTDCDLELEDWRPDLCQCKCKYRNAPPVPCGEGFRWSRRHCKCVCDKQPGDCPPNKVWNSQTCGCTCKERRYKNCARRKQFVDEETCVCAGFLPETGHVSSPKPADQGGLRQEFYVVMFVAEFALLYLVFDAILYRKKAGLIYRVTRKCSKKGDDGSNVEDSREDIFSDNTHTATTDLPADYRGQHNMASEEYQRHV